MPEKRYKRYFSRRLEKPGVPALLEVFQAFWPTTLRGMGRVGPHQNIEAEGY